MDKIFDALETLYGNCGIPFFLSDEYGNIHWRNSACGTVIIFPKGINDTADTAQVSIDGELYTAQSNKLPSVNKTLMLWRVNTLTDVLMQLGSTDTYTDICYMLAKAKSDISDAEKNIRDKTVLNTLKRNIEVLTEIATVIYNRTAHTPSVYFLEQLRMITDEANKIMSDIPIVFRIDTEQSFTEDIPVNVGQRMFYVCMFSVLKAMVRCSSRKLFNLKIGRASDRVTLTSSFPLRSETHAGMITDDFEMYGAKLYIGYIGGKMKYTTENDFAHIEISIPCGRAVSLNSPSFSPSGDVCPAVAGIFLSNITDDA